MRGGGGRAGRFGARGVHEYGRDRPTPPAVTPKPVGYTLDKPVCFKFAIGNNCPNGDKCEYKHDRALAQQHIANMIHRYKSSVNYNPSVKAQESAAELRQFTFQFPEIPASEMVITEEEWYKFQEEELEREEAGDEGGDIAEGEDWPVDEYGAPYRS